MAVFCREVIFKDRESFMLRKFSFTMVQMFGLVILCVCLGCQPAKNGSEKNVDETITEVIKDAAVEQVSGTDEHFDFESFWNNETYALCDVLPAPTDTDVEKVEKILGYKLPAFYVELMRSRNGGMPLKNCFPTSEPTGWADDHIQISQFMAIGTEGSYSLCGEMGNRFWSEEWGYPEYGVYIADTPSAGHEMILLDYRKNGKDGEPEVIYIDQENDYQEVFLARDFETFVRGLVPESTYETEE